MAYERRDNEGALFKTRDRERDSQPEYQGRGKLDGVEFYINAWLNEARDGTRYMRLSFKPVEATAHEQTTVPPGGLDREDVDDGIPF